MPLLVEGILTAAFPLMGEKIWIRCSRAWHTDCETHGAVVSNLGGSRARAVRRGGCVWVCVRCAWVSVFRFVWEVCAFRNVGVWVCMCCGTIHNCVICVCESVCAPYLRLTNLLMFQLHNVSLPITTYCMLTALRYLEEKKRSLELLSADIVLLNRTGLAFLQSVLWLSVRACKGLSFRPLMHRHVPGATEHEPTAPRENHLQI